MKIIVEYFKISSSSIAISSGLKLKNKILEIIKNKNEQSMRIWDIAPKFLCQKHLLGEHRELHAIWNILTIYRGQGGYSKHPETKRWR